VELGVLTQSHNETFSVFNAVETERGVSFGMEVGIENNLQNEAISRGFILKVASE